MRKIGDDDTYGHNNDNDNVAPTLKTPPRQKNSCFPNKTFAKKQDRNARKTTCSETSSFSRKPHKTRDFQAFDQKSSKK